MGVRVQKYGGSSVADLRRLRIVAARVAATRAAGHEVVVVVSAMGNTTNELLALAREVSANPGRRELDMLVSVGERVSMALLAMALQELGVPARSFTGSQSGIITDESHANARVVEVRPERVRAALDAGEVAIVAGFQGVSRAREVTTLGRGGSDTTAVVLAAALKAEECEICSDVDGVYSADPRVVPGARRLDTMSLAEALAMARAGGQVLAEEAVAWAHAEGVVLRASATYSTQPGTRVSASPSPTRISAVVTDRELLYAPLSWLPRVPTACVRAASPVGLVLDRRNLHTDLPDLLPVATVSVIGRRVGADPKILAEVLDVSSRTGEELRDWWASSDSVTIRVAPLGASELERALHGHFCEGTTA